MRSVCACVCVWGGGDVSEIHKTCPQEHLLKRNVNRCILKRNEPERIVALVLKSTCTNLLILSLNPIALSTNTKNLEYHPPKLQALVYDILSSTTAVFSYARGSRKLSANEQFF